MRVRGLIALGLFVSFASPAMAIGLSVDCSSDPTATTTRTIIGATTRTYYITTSAETGVDVQLSTTGTATAELDSVHILAVTNGSNSTHVSTVVDWGNLDVATTADTTVTLTCAANATSDPISRMQTLSPFNQQNLASSGASFRALLSADEFADADPVAPLNFSPDQVRATQALQAIDGTFSLLGYGPNALLSGDAVFARGSDWIVKGTVRGSYAETDDANGKFTQADAEGSVLLSGRLDDDLRYAVAVTAGFGKADTTNQSATSHKLVLDGAVAFPFDTGLDLILGANWGVAHHDVDLGGATGEYDEQMASASIALRGEQRYGAMTVNPMLATNLGLGVLPDFTDSAATTHAGGTSVTASADASLKLSYAVPTDDETAQLTPFTKLTLSAYHQSYDENGGASTTSTGLGAELALGATLDLGAGARASLEGTLGRTGSTNSASVSGSISGAF